MKKNFHLVFSVFVLMVMTLSPLSQVLAQVQTETLPFVKTTMRVVALNPDLSGNASYLSWVLPNPEIGDTGVVRMGGPVNINDGEPLAAWLLGQKGPSNTPLILGFTPGEGAKSLQFSACAPGQDLNPEPYNDLFKTLLVADWAVKPGVEITVWADDNEGGGAGASQTVDYAMLQAAPKIEMLAILLPESMDNKASLAESLLADVWSNDMGNFGAFYLGWKDASTRGVALKNAGNFTQSLQVPECTVPGGEAVNDMHKPWLLVRKDQLFAQGNQWVKVSENDLQGDPGEQTTINLNDPAYRQPFITKYFLPTIYR